MSKPLVIYTRPFYGSGEETFEVYSGSDGREGAAAFAANLAESGRYSVVGVFEHVIAFQATVTAKVRVLEA